MPYSSAATAIIKSVCASGNLHFITPSPTPTPNNPPSFIALIEKLNCESGSISGFKKLSILPEKCEELK